MTFYVFKTKQPEPAPYMMKKHQPYKLSIEKCKNFSSRILQQQV